MTTTKWIVCEYDDEGEVINPEYVNAPDDSFWWIDKSNRLHVVLMKSSIWFRPDRIARVGHPDD